MQNPLHVIAVHLAFETLVALVSFPHACVVARCARFSFVLRGGRCLHALGRHILQRLRIAPRPPLFVLTAASIICRTRLCLLNVVIVSAQRLETWSAPCLVSCLSLPPPKMVHGSASSQDEEEEV